MGYWLIEDIQKYRKIRRVVPDTTPVAACLDLPLSKNANVELKNWSSECIQADEIVGHMQHATHALKWVREIITEYEFIKSGEKPE